MQSLDQETKINVLKIIFNIYEDFSIPRYEEVVRNLGQTCATNKKVLNNPSSNEYQLFEQVISEDIVSIEAKQVIMCTFLVAFLSVRGGLSNSNNQLMHNFANLFRQKGVAEQYIDTIQTTDNAFSPFLSAIAIINLTAPFINNSYYQKVIDLYLKDLALSKVEYHLNDCPNYQDIAVYLHQNLNNYIVKNGLINNANFNIEKNYTKLFEDNGLSSNIDANLFSRLILSVIRENSNKNTGFNKQVLESIIRDSRITYLHIDDIKSILTNFTIYGEDGDGLSLKERVQIRKLYLDMFKRQSHLKKYTDFALELARQTDKVTQKHLAMVFPSAKDLMEKMLRQYIRMLLS